MGVWVGRKILDDQLPWPVNHCRSFNVSTLRALSLSGLLSLAPEYSLYDRKQNGRVVQFLLSIGPVPRNTFLGTPT